MIAITGAVGRIFSSKRFEESWKTTLDQVRIHTCIHTYIHTYIHVHGLGSQSAGRIKAIFAEIDLDNSGTIDQGEFAKAMKILRVDLTSREIQEVSICCLYVCYHICRAFYNGILVIRFDYCMYVCICM